MIGQELRAAARVGREPTEDEYARAHAHAADHVVRSAPEPEQAEALAELVAMLSPRRS